MNYDSYVPISVEGMRVKTKIYSELHMDSFILNILSTYQKRNTGFDVLKIVNFGNTRVL